MATTIAILVVVFVLMVNVAKQVRSRSAEALTKGLLVKLDRLVLQYMDANHGELPPVATVFGAGRPIDEQSVARAARINNEEFVRILRAEPLWGKVFVDLPISVYDQVSLRDAWGQPIVFMPAGHRAVGMAPNDRSFFFSSGPDRRYLTRMDNLYSYESAEATP
jgi:hypothetical protein